MFKKFENVFQLTQDNQIWLLVWTVVIFIDHKNGIYAFFQMNPFRGKILRRVFLHTSVTAAIAKCAIEFSFIHCGPATMWNLCIKPTTEKALFRISMAQARKASAEMGSFVAEPSAFVARGDFCEATVEWMVRVICCYFIFMWNCNINEGR